ncbi:rhodanese-like domain-containing protein [Formosa sediminum]|uniref:Rhodanese-like domain-containing protein n=1 Tax=Formosa sediminum TaxID=2594004 RepID=A0A516GRB1_9FLAO|nr:rhodanese-like domain-containing protein [Formosa sediminum]QDO94049.1 rhodanese-like domain-containing protein [Formosa sediminum]
MSFLSSLFGINTKKNKAITSLNANQFKTAIATKNVQLLDVRTVSEFKSGHIKGAKNIDSFSSAFNSEIEKLDKQKAVYVYCKSGVRSKQSAKKLAAVGFTEIYNLKHGLLSYK